ncbi:ABC transporter substrate-binding protein [Sneathiella marina]|uniref:ABC transporter substrate-binding protein n=1 Tax=Sneathiella marina TaxID=2950108 RepID=A0ABY4W0R6_9PROT|nr:ABC transporter substrate-binding protein [Sneathiella marina]USG59663.1 ABC transporter substrate-binding protein [Sneathiella marina]
MNKKFIGLVSAIALLGTPALSVAADSVKIGFVTTLSTGAGAIGKDMREAVDLAVDHLGGKMAGKDIEIIYEDDGFKPEIGKQKTDKLVKKDKVDFVAGYIWSHVLMASYKSVVDSDTFLISSNAGPSPVAGKLCHENFFSTSWQNDQTPMAMGEVLNQRGIKNLYIMAPNYAAGKNMVTGVERTFKGKIVGKDMTKFPAQLDFSAELAKVRAAKPDALFVFYPGKHGAQFMKQYSQAALAASVPLYTVFTVDSISLPRIGELADGSLMTQFWSPDLDVPANKKFVADFKAKYGHYPSHYAAQSYDSIMLINSAVEKVKGDLSNRDDTRNALRLAEFDSIRGNFKFGQNHMPIQNFYLRQVGKDPEGVYTTKVVDTVYVDHQDTYVKDCKLSW